MPQNRPRPSEFMASRPSPSEFLAGRPTAGQRMPGSVLFQPPPGSRELLQRSNEPTQFELERQGGQAPYERAGQAALRGAELGAASGLGIPETKTPLRDMASGLYQTLTAPPEGWENLLPPGVLQGKRLAFGAARGMYENIREGIPETVSGLRGYAETGEPQELERAAHGAGRVAATVIPIRELVKPPLRAGARAVGEVVRSGVRRGVGAGPAAVARAEAAVAAERAGVAESNVAALKRAREDFIETQAQQVEKQTASDVNWEQSSRETFKNYLREVDDAAKAHREALAKVTAENEAGQAQVALRDKLLKTEIPASAAEVAQRLKALEATVEAEAKAMYPRIAGEADGAAIADRVAQEAADAMKESGPVPTEIQRIIDGYTPKETGEIPTIYPEVSGEGMGRLIDEGAFTPEELEGMGGQARAVPTFENLHSQYSTLGKSGYAARRAGDNFRASAYFRAQDVLREAMADLAKASGETASFAKAQKNFGEYMQRWHNRGSLSGGGGSPLAKVLDAFDPASAGTGGVPRSQTIARLLNNPESYSIAQRYLKGYKDAPIDSLKKLRDANTQAQGLPKKFTPKQLPMPKQVKVPDLPLREVLPETEVAKVSGLKPPPSAFDRQAFVKSQVQKAAESLGRWSGWDIAGMAGGVAQMLTGSPPTGFGVPLVRHGMGRVLERPGVQSWVARETTTAPPNPTAFPPPPGGAAAGPPAPPAGGLTPPPAAPSGPASGIGSKVKAAAKTAWSELSGPPGWNKPFQRDIAARASEIEARQRAQGPAGSLVDTVGDKLRGLGVKEVGPLNMELAVELDMIFEELGRRRPTPAQARSIEDALRMQNRPAYQTANKIRDRLGLPTGE